MRNIIVSNAVIKGYHEFQIRPPQCVLLPVTKEYENKHDPNACLIWVPELDKIPTNLWNETTDEKRGERVRTIATNWTGTTRAVFLFLGSFRQCRRGMH